MGWPSNGPSIIGEQLSVLLGQAPSKPIRASTLGNVPNIMGKERPFHDTKVWGGRFYDFEKI